ncbi:MAG TPA: hypothetical protein VNF03_15720 [Patescibacteria group bacterium]|nr:hypothetical protein [Patescibacteria group bacterium]
MSPATGTFVDHLASSYRFPLALAFGAGAGVSTAVMTGFPEFGKGYDPGAILLLTLGVPMVVVGTAAMIWARRWRAARRPRRAGRSLAAEPGAQPAPGVLIRSTAGGAVSS